jgi:hypothetical protein
VKKSSVTASQLSSKRLQRYPVYVFLQLSAQPLGVCPPETTALEVILILSFFVS